MGQFKVCEVTRDVPELAELACTCRRGPDVAIAAVNEIIPVAKGAIQLSVQLHFAHMLGKSRSMLLGRVHVVTPW